MSEDYERLLELLAEVSDLQSAASVLGWDELTYMPEGGASARGEQMATLSRLAHERFTSDAVGQLLGKLEAAGVGHGDEPADLVVHETRVQYDRMKLVPGHWVSRHAEASSKAYQAWAQARQAKDFSLFAPDLQVQVDLAKERGSYVPTAADSYQGLLYFHEPDFSVDELDRLFGDLASFLSPLLKEISAHSQRVDRSWTDVEWPEADQWRAFRLATEAIGFDYRHGRLDPTIHPFETSFDIDDVRLTTRVIPRDLFSGFFGSLHEAGHGLYERGMPVAFRRTPMAQAPSSGMHESQSRLWENQVGRGRPFWQFFFPRLQALFPEQLRGKSAEDVYRAANWSGPSFNRTEADEVSYNLHVILRFRLERRLFAGQLTVSELPAAWREETRALLGVEPADDLIGVLQDVHWSHGGFAAFPSYTLGNVIAAQLMAAARRALPGLDQDFTRGEFSGLLGWLKREVHQQGARFTTKALVERATGEPLGIGAYRAYIEEKYRELYALR